jgi:hypothetical protein
MGRQLYISMQCLCTSNKENLAANIYVFCLVKYTTPEEEHCKLWYVKVSETERKTKHL